MTAILNTLHLELDAVKAAWELADCADELESLEEQMADLEDRIANLTDEPEVAEVFEAKRFVSDGIWYHYQRANGEKVFIARFKHRGPIGRRDFKKALTGTSVDAYLEKLDAGIPPMKAAPGLMQKLEEMVEARRKGR
jgi:hypothetical protein